MTTRQPIFDLAHRKVWVPGHRGMLGSAIVRRLQQESCEVLTVDRNVVDLRAKDAVDQYVAKTAPDAIILAAARVGGILENNNHPMEFLYWNMEIQNSVIGAAHRHGVKKLVFLGSSCIYPKMAPQPIPEEALLSGPLEPTNEWYAIAKISGLKLCQAFRRQFGNDFISCMPTNLYGPNDNFDLLSSHVLPALLAKVHDAKVQGRDHLPVWGSGKPLREFMHVDDCADAIVHLTKHYSEEMPINVGSGQEISILELAQLIVKVVGADIRVVLDPRKPDGPPRKLVDTRRLQALGWRSKVPLEEGIRSTYTWYLKNVAASA